MRFTVLHNRHHKVSQSVLFMYCKTITILLRIRVRGHFVMSITKNHECHYVTVLDNAQRSNYYWRIWKADVSSVRSSSEQILHKPRWIDHFRITFGLFFKASLGAHPFIWKLVFICIWMETNFHMKRWALGLALKKRPKVIRKWSIQVNWICAHVRV